MDDRHERFIAWLESGADQPLPRDVGLHAWVCQVCMGQVAALDSLRAIDLGRAPLPSWQVVAQRGTSGLRPAGRFAATALGATAALSFVAFGAGQLIADRLQGNGQVLAAQGSPKPSASPTPTVTPSPTPSASPTPSPSVVPSPAPAAAATPRPIVLPTRQPTPHATARPTASPTPSASGAATQSPTPTPSPTPSPTATPSATPTPSASAQTGSPNRS